MFVRRFAGSLRFAYASFEGAHPYESSSISINTSPRTDYRRTLATMPLKVHGFIASPPVRSVMMVCEAMDVKYSFIEVNPMAGEHRTPEFLKLCPVHSLPVIEDEDYVLFDSHAIACYLANKYSKDDKWYPKNARQRGIVDQRLHFNNGMLILRFKDLLVPILAGRSKQLDPNAVKRVEEGMKQFDTLLADNTFIAGSNPTIADCCSCTIVLSIQVFVPKSVSSRVLAWLQRCESTLPGFHKVNQPALSILASLKTSML